MRAVIFDCFGVLTTEGLEVFYAKYFKDSPEKLAKAKNIIGQLNLGNITHDDYIHQVAVLGDIGKDVVRDYIEDNKANEPLLDYIRSELKPKYKIGMLSNAGGNWLDELFDEEDIKLFDALILSAEVGLTKPDPEIYRLAANKLGVLPEECIFIDDLAHYVKAAEKVGMKAIRYHDFSQAKGEIEDLLATSDN